MANRQLPGSQERRAPTARAPASPGAGPPRCAAARPSRWWPPARARARAAPPPHRPPARAPGGEALSHPTRAAGARRPQGQPQRCACRQRQHLVHERQHADEHRNSTAPTQRCQSASSGQRAAQYPTPSPRARLVQQRPPLGALPRRLWERRALGERAQPGAQKSLQRHTRLCKPTRRAPLRTSCTWHVTRTRVVSKQYYMRERSRTLACTICMLRKRPRCCRSQSHAHGLFEACQEVRGAAHARPASQMPPLSSVLVRACGCRAPAAACRARAQRRHLLFKPMLWCHSSPHWRTATVAPRLRGDPAGAAAAVARAAPAGAAAAGRGRGAGGARARRGRLVVVRADAEPLRVAVVGAAVAGAVAGGRARVAAARAARPLQRHAALGRQLRQPARARSVGTRALLPLGASEVCMLVELPTCHARIWSPHILRARDTDEQLALTSMLLRPRARPGSVCSTHSRERARREGGRGVRRSHTLALTAQLASCALLQSVCSSF